MNRSFIASVLFHLVFIGLAVLGLPRMAERLPIDEPFTVEIVGIPAAPEPTEEPPAPPPAEAAPLPPRQAASPAPPPPAPEPEPEPEPAPEPPQQLAAPEPPPPPPAPEPPPPPAPEPPPPPPPPPAAEPVPAQAAAPVPPARPRARPEPPKPVETAAPAPEPPAPEPPKVEPPAVKVAARPKPPEKPAPPKKAEPSPAPVAKDDNDFNALLRSVEQQNRRVEAPERRPGTGNAEAARTAPPAAMAAPVALSASELAGIRRQIERCWNVPIGVPGIEAMRVSLRIQLEADGSVREVSIEESGRLDADSGFRTVAESARRAVLSCRLDLPAEKYTVWRDMVLTFSPGDALSG